MDSPPLTLVVLAAGIGSRYGGLKQLEAVGPHGATLMDYSVFDAARAGFTDVVFVIRGDMEDAFRSRAAGLYGSRLAVGIAIQRPDDLPEGFAPAGRSKPWGTAHAVLAAAGLVQGPFAVVNADDFYGAPAFAALAQFLRAGAARGPAAVPEWAMMGYRLRDTTSEAGGVNRAVARTEGGWLASLEEILDIVREPGGAFRGRTGRATVTLDGDDVVSMNMWGFTPPVFPALQTALARFLAAPGAAAAGELPLPAAVEAAVQRGVARVRVLEPGSRWFGMTYRSDRGSVHAALGELVAAGRYPGKLW